VDAGAVRAANIADQVLPLSQPVPSPLIGTEREDIVPFKFIQDAGFLHRRLLSVDWFLFRSLVGRISLNLPLVTCVRA
jgi:hypothetical protein